MPRVTTSPRLAAIGVATLSGFILNFSDSKMIVIMIEPRNRLANEAVVTLVDMRVNKWSYSKWPSLIKSVKQATNEANKPTTMDWA